MEPTNEQIWETIGGDLPPSYCDRLRKLFRSPSSACSALDAGSVAAGPDRYTVTHAHDHKTLKLGDIVVMGETPRMENVLIRVDDMTVHGLCGTFDQYVHLEPNAKADEHE